MTDTTTLTTTPDAHDLLEQRPELAGVGVSDAVNAVASA
jgi:hypothetical protein